MAGRLIWSGEQLERLRAEIRAAKAADSAADFRGDKVEPGIVMVGDHGVYLMAWCHRDPPANDEGIPAAYATGCNPAVDDDFYENKVAIWGGDDGAEYFELACFEAFLDPAIIEVIAEVSPRQILLKSRSAP